MNIGKKRITVFEHQSLWTHKGENRLTAKQLESLQSFYGEKGVPYFTLIHKGVKFCEYVGVLQVGNTTIEILPKADQNGLEENDWRALLIGMLRTVGVFRIEAPSSSSLQVKRNSILDLYFELFIQEVQLLLHQGLAKKYRKATGNLSALKGSIQFSQHLKENIVHQERFYTRFTTFDVQHQLHSILYKTLLLISRINTNSQLQSKLGALLLDFPEMPDVKATEAAFKRLVFNRKTEAYRKAVEIARLLLLNYHPDVSKGRNHVLALLFDMNLLWEQFVYVSLRKQLKKEDKAQTITAQSSKYFWKAEKGQRSSMRPDIVINKGRDNCVVLDTKWKNLGRNNPSPADLRQLYVYLKYYGARKVALVYPGPEANVSKGNYYLEKVEEPGEMECSVISIPTNPIMEDWQKAIYRQIKGLL